MYCRYCGTQLADGTAFCIKCGKKTVKLRPRSVEASGADEPVAAPAPLPVIPPPVQKPAWYEGIKRAAAQAAEKAGPVAAKIAAGAKNVFGSVFAFTKLFDTGMWTVCGVFLGLELVALVELIASATGSGLLFGFLEGVPTVLLLAWLLCLVIAQITLISAYNYKQTDEYKQAVSAEADESLEPDTNSLPETRLVMEGAPDSELSEGEGAPLQDMAEEPPVREKLSQEAEDIIAELEKLSLTL